jgi:predicted Zn finger-like uncharacterized protein
MILTCPECATRYFVEDERLGAQGRTVRCAGCGAAWRAAAEEPLELTATAEEGAVARAPSEPVSFRAAEPVALEDLPAPELPKAFRAKAEHQRRVRRAAAAGVVWAGLACGFAVLMFGAWFFRVEVVKLYPSAAGAYAMAGMTVNPTGLEFEDVQAAPAPDGLAAIVVTGVIRNVDDEAHVAPPLRVALLDKSNHKLAKRVVTLPGAPIAPGKTISFATSLPDPDASAADADVTFALDLAPKPRKPLKAPKLVKAKAKPQHPHAKPAPARVAQAALPPGGLRPPIGAETLSAIEAKPLASGDPYALDSAAPKALSAPPHG